VGTRVPTRKFSAEMAKLIDERGLQVATGDPRRTRSALEMAMATPLARKASKAMITPQAPLHDVVLKVIRWVRKLTLMLLLQHSRDVKAEIQPLPQGRYPRQLWQDVSNALTCDAGMPKADIAGASKQIVKWNA